EPSSLPAILLYACVCAERDAALLSASRCGRSYLSSVHLRLGDGFLILIFFQCSFCTYTAMSSLFFFTLDIHAHQWHLFCSPEPARLAGGGYVSRGKAQYTDKCMYAPASSLSSRPFLAHSFPSIHPLRMTLSPPFSLAVLLLARICLFSPLVFLTFLRPPLPSILLVCSPMILIYRLSLLPDTKDAKTSLLTPPRGFWAARAANPGAAAGKEVCTHLLPLLLRSSLLQLSAPLPAICTSAPYLVRASRLDRSLVLAGFSPSPYSGLYPALAFFSFLHLAPSRSVSPSVFTRWRSDVYGGGGARVLVRAVSTATPALSSDLRLEMSALSRTLPRVRAYGFTPSPQLLGSRPRAMSSLSAMSASSAGKWGMRDTLRARCSRGAGMPRAGK
ncbi:hypothetical protein C8J57DRAFT_1558672, partial [Mycena rebaudengoi]